MKYLLYTIILLLLASCKCVNTLPAETKTIVRTEVKEIIRDSIVELPSDSAWLKALLACDSAGNVYLKTIEEYQQGTNIKLPLPEIKYNTVIVTAKVDSSAIYLQWKERHSFKDSIQVIVQPPVEIKEPSNWQWFQIWVGRISLGIFILLAIFKTKKFII